MKGFLEGGIPQGRNSEVVQDYVDANESIIALSLELSEIMCSHVQLVPEVFRD